MQKLQSGIFIKKKKKKKMQRVGIILNWTRNKRVDVNGNGSFWCWAGWVRKDVVLFLFPHMNKGLELGRVRNVIKSGLGDLI